jgi:hypothetical protein
MIPSLSSALSTVFANVTVDLSALETVEFTSFPIPAISRGTWQQLFAQVLLATKTILNQLL